MAKFRGFVKPDAVRVKVFDGEHWIELKRRLSVGEERDAYKELVAMQDGRVVPNVEFIGGLGDVYAYLVDWSLTDNGKAVPITESDTQRLAALRGLDPDDLKEISTAVEAHVKAMSAERDAEKNARAGENNSSAISASAA